MSYRINVIIEDNIWNELKRVPRGERSKMINEALADKLLRQQRLQAGKAMDAISKRLPAFTSDQIVSWIRKDRSRPT